MSVLLARVDERLVHGQIITSWTKHLGVNHIVIVDDKIAADSFMFEVLTLSAPTGLEFEVFSTDQAIGYLEKNASKNSMLLFKTIATAHRLISKGYPLERLNIGNVSSGPNRTVISKNVSLSKEEIDDLKDLETKGVEVYLQMLYTDQEVNINKFI